MYGFRHQEKTAAFFDPSLAGVNEPDRTLDLTGDSARKTPDVIVHYAEKNRLILIETLSRSVQSGSKCLKKGLFLGLAYENHHSAQSFLSQTDWESVNWVAKFSEHVIHFDRECLLGPYPGAMSTKRLTGI